MLEVFKSKLDSKTKMEIPIVSQNQTRSTRNLKLRCNTVDEEKIKQKMPHTRTLSLSKKAEQDKKEAEQEN